MARIMNMRTGEIIALAPEHRIGRHRVSSNTVVSSPDVSRDHATISWGGEFWLLQDNSSNGTFVNGAKISRGNQLRLTKGEKVNFANLEGDTWLMLDEDAPHCQRRSVMRISRELAIFDDKRALDFHRH